MARFVLVCLKFHCCSWYIRVEDTLEESGDNKKGKEKMVEEKERRIVEWGHPLTICYELCLLLEANSS